MVAYVVLKNNTLSLLTIFFLHLSLWVQLFLKDIEIIIRLKDFWFFTSKSSSRTARSFLVKHLYFKRYSGFLDIFRIRKLNEQRRPTDLSNHDTILNRIKNHLERL